MKLIATLLASLLLVGANNLLNTDNSQAIEEQSWTDFESLPEDFELFNRSDKNYTNISFYNGNMVVAHNNSSAKNTKYYGSLIQINKSKYYQDFSFEMEFDVSSALNEKSFVGLMYRAQKSTSYLSGYLSKYQYGGGSYFAGIDDKATFYNDSLSSSAKLNNGVHTLKIEVKKNDAFQYLDDSLISTSDLRNKDSYLGYTKPKGSLALLVSNMTINVKSITIKGNSEEPSNTNPIIDTYQDKNDIVNAPTVISEVTSSSNLDFNQEKLPSNVILTVDDSLNVIDKEGAIIDTFDSILSNKLQHKVTPVVRLNSENAASSLIDYLKENTDLIDLSIISSDTSLLKQVKTNVSYVRAIYEANQYSKELPHIANKAMAIGVSLDSTNLTRDDIEYIHARFKSVWLRVDTSSKMDIYNAINTGAYGIISSDYMSIYDAYASYPVDSYIRRSFNPAHRGLPNKYNENSLNGCMAAIDDGATHIEIDAYLTTDNEIVIMHDSNVARTTNGEGNIESMSLEEVKKLKLDLVEPYEEVPTLDEIILAMKEKDSSCVMILEIKSGNLKLIDKLKEVIKKYDFADQIVVISFSLPVLNAMKDVLPEIPTSYLGTINAATFVQGVKTMGQYNTGVDTTRGAANKTFNEQYLKDRGFLGFYWTYDSKEEFNKDASAGLIGLTTNNADYLANEVYMVYANDSSTSDTLEIGSPIEVITKTYKGDESTELGEIFYLEEYETCYKAIAKYRNSTGNYYSNEITINKESKPIKDDSSSSEGNTSNGCGGSIAAISILTSSVSLLGISLILIKGRRKEER